LSRFFKAEVISNLPLNSKNSLLTLKPSESVIDPEPGQFYMIEVCNGRDPFLMRPFSLFRKTPWGIQFLYEIRGKGTTMMKGFKDGEVIKLLGPLGKGYPEPEKDKVPLLVAGGIGIASIFSLAEIFGKKACLFYGARNREGLLMLDELKGTVGELIISTDDGSVGYKGTVVDAFNNFLTSHFSLLTSYLLYACGHKQMLEVLSRTALKNGINGYISAEENMACGLGACLGCAIRAKSREQRAKSRKRKVKNLNSVLSLQSSALCYKMVCKDGPVFPIEEIVW
jgi:dihydroorotate dehydrogenase electron transfer subunit